jgi:hypothetical protein
MPVCLCFAGALLGELGLYNRENKDIEDGELRIESGEQRE